MGGFTFSRDQSAGTYDGKVETYSVDVAHSTLLAPGDSVTITGTSDTAGLGGIDTAGTTGSMSGVVVGFEPQYEGEALNETGLPASKAGVARVSIDRDLLFDADVANGPLVLADVGLNLNQVVTAASKLGGLTVSNMTLNATGKATTSTFPWRIVRLLEDSDGVLGGRATVRMNATTTTSGATGV